MAFFDNDVDLEAYCVVTEEQHLKEPLEPQSELDDPWHSSKGGVLPGSEYAWLSCGSRFRVVSTSTGASVMDWSFESPLEKAVVSCVVPLPSNFSPSHNGTQDLGLRLAVALMIDGHRGLVVVLATGPAIRTRVLSSVRVHSHILSMALVTSGTQDDDESPLHSVLCRMQGVLALGLLGGEVLLLDLRADDAIGDGTSSGDTHAMVFTVRDNLAHKVAETLITGDHLALLLNSGSYVEGQFMLQLPDGQVKSKSPKHLVGVPALLYVPQLASLFVGFSFGVFQLWSLSDFTLVLTSPLIESLLPVTRLSWQPPSDDPRACCYLWVSYGHPGLRRAPFAWLFALTWERCRRIVGYGDLYLTLQSFRRVFELEVAPAGLTGEVTLTNVQTITRRPPAGDASLAWFSWASGQKAGALLFDLDQWYKAQMPDNVCVGAETFIARYTLDVDCEPDQLHLGAQLDEATVARFDAIRRREEHFFPSSTSFHTTWLVGDRVIRASHPGVQAQALRELTRAGPIGIAAPAALFRRCVNAGLRAALSDVEPTLLDSTESQREFLLSLCLERRPRLALHCALHWADGIQEALGGSLDHWLEWAWQQARFAKATADNICVPLFDLSGRSLDSTTHATLLLAIGQVCQLASIFKRLRDHLLNRKLTARLQETEERYCALALASLYLGGVRWFVSAALLPERPDAHPTLANIPFPVVALSDNYRQRRAELQRTHQAGELLYIDALVARHPRVCTLWRQEGGDGQYPPPSLQAILRVHLLDDMDEEYKHLLIFYLLQDLATLQRYDGLDSESLVSSYPELMPEQRQLARALWLLDHRDFDDAVLALTSARPEPWQRNLALRALHAQGRHRLAAQLLHNWGPPIGLAGHQLAVSILLHCDRLTNALSLLREVGTGATMPTLLEHFFHGCHNNNAMGEALKLSLRPNEEEVLFRFLERECGGARGIDMRALYLLSHGRIVEATALAPPPGQPASSTRDLLLAAYTRTLPQVTLDIASFCRRQRGDLGRFTTVSRPEPLTMGVRQTASQEALFAASLMATAAASRTPQLTGGHTQQLPFLRSPRSCAGSVGRRTPAIVPRSVSTPTPGSKRKREHTDADELLMTPRVRRRILESPAMRPPTSILKARAIPEMSTPPSIRKIRFSLNLEEEGDASPSLRRSASFLDEPAPNKVVRHEAVIDEDSEESVEEEEEEEEADEVDDSDSVTKAEGMDSLQQVESVPLPEINKCNKMTQEKEHRSDIFEGVKYVYTTAVGVVEDLDTSVQKVLDIDSSVQEVDDMDTSIQEIDDVDSTNQDAEEVDSSIQDVEDSDIEELEVSKIPKSQQLLLDDSRPFIVQNRFQGQRNISATDTEFSVEETSVEDCNVSKEEDDIVCIEEVDDGYKGNGGQIEVVPVIASKEGYTEMGEHISIEEEPAVKESEPDTSSEIEELEDELELAEDVEEEEEEEDQDDIYEAMEVDQVEENTTTARVRRPVFANIDLDESEAEDVASSEDILVASSSSPNLSQAYGSSQETLEVPTNSELSENPFPENLDRPVSEYFHIPSSSSDLHESNVVEHTEGAVDPEEVDAITKMERVVHREDKEKRVSRSNFVDLDDDEDDQDEAGQRDDDSDDLEDLDDEEANENAERKHGMKVADSPTSSELHMLIKDAPEDEEEEAEEEEDLNESLEEEESDSQDDDSQSESSSSSDIVCLDEEAEPADVESAVLTPLAPMISEVCTKDLEEEDEEDMLNRAIRMSTEQHEEIAVVETRNVDDDVVIDNEGVNEGVEEIDIDQYVVEPESDPLVEVVEDAGDVQQVGSDLVNVESVDDIQEIVDQAAADENECMDETSTADDELNKAILCLSNPDEISEDRAANDGSVEDLGLVIHASPQWETGSDRSSPTRRQTRSLHIRETDIAPAKSDDLDVPVIQVSESEASPARSEASIPTRRQLRSSSRLSDKHPASKTETQRQSEPEGVELPTTLVSESEGSPAGSEASETYRRRTRSSVLRSRTLENPSNKGELATETELDLSADRIPGSASPAGSDKSSFYLRRLQSTLVDKPLHVVEDTGSPTGSETGSVTRRRTRLSLMLDSQEVAGSSKGARGDETSARKGRKSWAGSQSVGGSPARSTSSTAGRRASTLWKADDTTVTPAGGRKRRLTGDVEMSPAVPTPTRSNSALGWVSTTGSQELEEFASSRRLTRYQRSMLGRSFSSVSQVSGNPVEEEVATPSEGGDSDDASSTASGRKRRASFNRAVTKMSPARTRAGSLPPTRGPHSLDGDFGDSVSDTRRDVTKPETRNLRPRRACASLGGAAPLAELNTILEESTVTETESVEALATDEPGPSTRRTVRLSPVLEEAHNLRRRSRPASASRKSSIMLRGKRASFDAAPRKSRK